MDMCCISQATELDQESLVMLTSTWAPRRMNCRHREAKVSSKQIGVEKRTPPASNTVYSSPGSQKWVSALRSHS